MASTLKSVEMTPPVYPTSGVGLGGRTTHFARGEYTLTAALVVNDVIQLFKLPQNARVVGGLIKSDDLDTGSAAITLHVGDAGDVDRYFSSSTVAQAGGVDRAMAATGVDYLNTARTLVYLTVAVAPATGTTTGTIVVLIEYMVEEPK